MAQSVAQKRLFHEYRLLATNPPDGITAGPISEDDLFHWEAIIQGPEDTPFEGGVFPAELKFPRDYPLSPPKMTFTGVDLWHPNGTATSSPPPRARQSGTAANGKCNSLPQRRSLHLDPAPTRRRPEPLRVRERAMEPHPERGEDLDLGDEHVGRAKR